MTHRIYLAQSVVAAQVGCTVGEARAIIERLARDTEEPVEFVVDELLAGNVSLGTATLA